MRLVQCELKSGETVRVCWLEPKVKPGDMVTLKGEDSEWEVTAVYRDSESQGPPDVSWKVGGLT